MNKYSKRACLLALCLLPTLAMAHPGHDASATFMQGLLHPVTGIDHLLAMVAVGIWAAQQGGRMLWLAPLSFVTLMAVGAMMATTGITLSHVEFGISFSIVVLGTAIAFSLRTQPIIGAIVVGTFAVFHGYAHGVEAHNGLSYHFISGMLIATALLHVAGIAAAVTIKRYLSSRAVRWTGASIALGGLALLVGA